MLCCQLLQCCDRLGRQSNILEVKLFILLCVKVFPDTPICELAYYILPVVFEILTVDFSLLLCQNTDPKDLDIKTECVSVDFFLCSVMKPQGSAGSCPRSWSTCEESSVSEVTLV